MREIKYRALLPALGVLDFVELFLGDADRSPPCIHLSGQINFIGENEHTFDPDEGARILATRPLHPELTPNPDLPDDTRLWAVLQNLSGGTWAGCVYDVEMILEKLNSQ